jgi:hypothetical protein
MNNLLINLLKSIMDTDCEKLDISHRYGATSYIDFIKQSELQENVMKGKDDFDRSFIVFKAEIIYEDSKFNKKKINTFTTFFQRYMDDLLLWIVCGNDGPLLFDTIRGANITQLKLLDDLLKNGFVDLRPDMNYAELNIYPFGIVDNLVVKPIKIQLGYTI